MRAIVLLSALAPLALLVAACGSDPGSTGGEGELAFSKYDAVQNQDLTLDLTIAAEAGLAKAGCDFRDAL